jgi:small subunit ribosomal protein S1
MAHRRVSRDLTHPQQQRLSSPQATPTSLERTVIIVTVMTPLPQISDEQRTNFADLLEQSFQKPLIPGSVCVGEVLKVDKDGLMVDVGGKCEGFVPLKEITECDSYEALKVAYKPGQVVELFVMRSFLDNDSQYLLSTRRVTSFKTWERLKDLKDQNQTVEITVTNLTKGGLLVNVLGLKGFVPASQLRIAKPITEVIGDTLPAKILEVDKSKNKLILSHRQAVFEQKAAMRAETLDRLHEGEIVEGEVVKITDFGAFIDINGIDGLLPLSEISWKRIKHPSESLVIGQMLTVRVLTVDKELQRISLSLKRMEADPWDLVTTRFAIGENVVSRVSKMLSSGILVELMPGVEAFCAFDPHGKFYYMDTFYAFEIVAIAAEERRITVEFRGDVDQPAPETPAAAEPELAMV